MALNRSLSIVIRCSGKTPLRMYPGQKLRIGRHSSNEYVLNDGTVSRFHAGIVWDRDEDRPYVLDNKSANGVEVDGELIDERSYLTGGNTVQVGKFALVIELREETDGARTSGEDYLEDDDEQVKLFSDKGADLKGELLGSTAMHRLCLNLEENQRTGTLRVVPRDEEIGEFVVVFSQGKVVTAEGEDFTGRQALKVLMGLDQSDYSFTRDLTPSETEFLNLSVQKFLAQIAGKD